MQYEIVTTGEFDAWLDGLRDPLAIRAINKNIVKLSAGLFGNAKSIGEGLSELKVDVGQGYRVYFVTRRLVVIVLLTGGDKSSQTRDVKRAREMAADLE